MDPFLLHAVFCLNWVNRNIVLTFPLYHYVKNKNELSRPFSTGTRGFWNLLNIMRFSFLCAWFFSCPVNICNKLSMGSNVSMGNNVPCTSAKHKVYITVLHTNKQQQNNSSQTVSVKLFKHDHLWWCDKECWVRSVLLTRHNVFIWNCDTATL